MRKRILPRLHRYHVRALVVMDTPGFPDGPLQPVTKPVTIAKFLFRGSALAEAAVLNRGTSRKPYFVERMPWR